MKNKIIDLSIPCDHQSEGVEIIQQENPPIYLGQKCFAYDLKIKSHHGTYFETSSHVFRNGKDTCEFPLEKLIRPGICINIIQDRRCITADDLDSACKTNLEQDHALLVNVGSQTNKYFSREAAQWMSEKKVAIFGSNTNCYDNGFENPTGFFIDLFKAEIPIVANITNLVLLPENGFRIIVLPLNIHGICITPCRIIAILDI
jgi:kynurenine formamidase